MHASIWKFAGTPDELPRRYDAMIEKIPRARMRLHLCLRADGIVLVDICPTKDVFESFARGDEPIRSSTASSNGPGTGNSARRRPNGLLWVCGRPGERL